MPSGDMWFGREALNPVVSGEKRVWCKEGCELWDSLWSLQPGGIEIAKRTNRMRVERSDGGGGTRIWYVGCYVFEKIGFRTQSRFVWYFLSRFVGMLKDTYQCSVGIGKVTLRKLTLLKLIVIVDYDLMDFFYSGDACSWKNIPVCVNRLVCSWASSEYKAGSSKAWAEACATPDHIGGISFLSEKPFPAAIM